MTSSDSFDNQKTYACVRPDDSNLTVYEDGVVLATVGRISTSLTDRNLIIGGFDNQGTISTYFEGTLSSFCVSGHAGFDHAAHNTNLRALLTCLLYTSPSPRDGLLSRMPSSA